MSMSFPTTPAIWILATEARGVVAKVLRSVIFEEGDYSSESSTAHNDSRECQEH